MLRRTSYLFLLSCSALFLASCLKKEVFPDEPVITYQSFTPKSIDQAQLVFSFTDGDGDVGLKQSDNVHLSGPDSIYYYNLYIKTYYKNYQGVFKDTFITYTQTITVFNPQTSQYESKVITVIDTGLIRQRIQYIPVNNKDKSVKGEIYVDLNGYRQSVKHKVIKYKFFIYDRAHHKSNVVETPELKVP